MKKESLYESTINCLQCKKEFKTKKSKSKIYQLKYMNRELRQIYDLPDLNVEPFYYSVHTCEHCGFSFTEQFNSYFLPKTQEEIIDLLKNWKKRSYNIEKTPLDALAMYKMALYMAKSKKETEYVKASISLKIAWIYDDLKYEEKATEFRKLAYEYYIASYQNGDYEKSSQTIYALDYLLATLSYKLNNLSAATFHFSKVFQNQAFYTNRKIIDLTREQWDEIKKIKEK